MPQRPNLIVIVADQLRVDCLPGFNPESPVQTPHLDRLAAEGVRFAEAFALDHLFAATARRPRRAPLSRAHRHPKRLRPAPRAPGAPR